jgi:hypothetical protein
LYFSLIPSYFYITNIPSKILFLQSKNIARAKEGVLPPRRKPGGKTFSRLYTMTCKKQEEIVFFLRKNENQHTFSKLIPMKDFKKILYILPVIGLNIGFFARKYYSKSILGSM